MNYEEEIKRLNEKIEFLSRTNMLYSDWEHRDTQVTSELIRKGIEEHKINAELRVEIAAERQWLIDSGLIGVLKHCEDLLREDGHEDAVDDVQNMIAKIKARGQA